MSKLHPLKIKFLFLLFFIAVFSSCERINPKDITIIDGIELGTSVNELNRQFDSSGIQAKVFYTQSLFSNPDQIQQNIIKLYITNLFNFSKYSSPYLNHYGLYVPVLMFGSQNIEGMRVLLIHTSVAMLLSKYNYSGDINQNINLTKVNQVPSIDQAVSNGVIENIKEMLINRYGEPVDSLESQYSTLYVIEGTKIKDFYSDSAHIGTTYYWKTKYYTVKFFEGILSPSEIWNSTLGSYVLYPNYQEYNRQLDPTMGEEICRVYSYISYNLNDKAIKRMNLDKPDL